MIASSSDIKQQQTHESASRRVELTIPALAVASLNAHIRGTSNSYKPQLINKLGVVLWV